MAMTEAVHAIEERLDELRRTYEIVVNSAVGTDYKNKLGGVLDIIKTKMLECETALRFIKPENNYLNED